MPPKVNFKHPERSFAEVRETSAMKLTDRFVEKNPYFDISCPFELIKVKSVKKQFFLSEKRLEYRYLYFGISAVFSLTLMLLRRLDITRSSLQLLFAHCLSALN